jgi:hypothetical protein
MHSIYFYVCGASNVYEPGHLKIGSKPFPTIHVMKQRNCKYNSVELGQIVFYLVVHVHYHLKLVDRWNKTDFYAFFKRNEFIELVFNCFLVVL